MILTTAQPQHTHKLNFHLFMITLPSSVLRERSSSFKSWFFSATLLQALREFLLLLIFLCIILDIVFFLFTSYYFDAS